MKKPGLIILGIILFFGLIIGLTYVSHFNKIVKLEEGAKEQWANVESSYQRRMDLIPNLVNTVKGYAQHEQETLTQVIEARSKATSVTIDPTKLNAANVEQFQAAQNGLTSALSKLLVVVEKYPDLKANQNFLELQAQLEGTENRINVERIKYNEVVKIYNTYIKSMFQKIFFSSKQDMGYFKSEAQAAKAPEVKF